MASPTARSFNNSFFSQMLSLQLVLRLSSHFNDESRNHYIYTRIYVLYITYYVVRQFTAKSLYIVYHCCTLWIFTDCLIQIWVGLLVSDLKRCHPESCEQRVVVSLYHYRTREKKKKGAPLQILSAKDATSLGIDIIQMEFLSTLLGWLVVCPNKLWCLCGWPMDSDSS